GLEVERARLATARHSCGIGSKRRSGESLDEARARRRHRSSRSASAQRSKPTAHGGAEGSHPRVVSQRGRELWISGRRVDGQTSDRGDREDLWRALPSRSRREGEAGGGLEPTET